MSLYYVVLFYGAEAEAVALVRPHNVLLGPLLLALFGEQLHLQATGNPRNGFGQTLEQSLFARKLWQ